MWKLCSPVADEGGDANADAYTQVVVQGVGVEVWYRCVGTCVHMRWVCGTCVGTHTGERCEVHVVVHVGTARWERGKIASISCSSTTTPASKSQLVCATIPEYDLCLQLGEAKTPEGEKTPKLGR